MGSAVLAVDPGLTTGVATFHPITLKVETYECTTIKDLNLIFRDLNPDLVIIERGFIIGNAGARIDQIEWTGVAKALAFIYDAAVRMDEPSIPSWVYTRFNCRRKGISQHRFDALCHLFKWMYELKLETESSEETFKSSVTLPTLAILGGTLNPKVEL